MKTKRFIFSLTQTGMRLTILVSMLMMAFGSRFGGVGAAPLRANADVRVYFSITGNSTVTGAPNSGDYRDSDIYYWDGSAFSRVVDSNGTLSLPSGANVDGFHRVDGTHFYMTFTAQVNPPGPSNTTEVEDIAFYNAGTWTLFFDGTANGLPGGSNIDALTVVDATHFYTSFTSQVNPSGPGNTVEDEDIAYYNAGLWSAVFDGSTHGLPGGSDIDAMNVVDANHIYMSFDSDVNISGFGTVQDEDIVYYDNGVWSLYFDGTAQGLTNNNHDIDAFSLVFSQIITFGALADKTFGDPDFNVSATTSSGLPVSFSASGNCTVVGTLVHLTSDGSCTITAFQAGNANYLPAADVPQTFTINPAPAGVTFDLYAVTGSTTLPGLAAPVTVWGYNTSNTPVTKPGGPVLIVDQGLSVTITLHNELAETTALLFQGQSMLPDLTGAAPAGTRTYTFTASQPGTYLYEAGLIPGTQHQVAMGLYGALIVRPTGAPAQAYADTATAFDTEQVLVLSELDTALNTSANPAAFDMREYSPKYYLINGETYPDTDPISALAGDAVLLRYVDAGLQAHAMSPLGLTQTLVGQDGNAMAFPHAVVSETIAPGQTLDAIITIPATGGPYPLYDASLFLRNNTGKGTFAGLGGMLTMITVGAAPAPSDTTGPISSSLALSSPTDGTVDVTVSASVSDATTGGSNVTAAEFYIDNTSGTPTSMTGAFASPTEAVTGTIPMAVVQALTAGGHTVYVRGQDSAGNWGSFATTVLTKPSSAPAGDSLYFSTAGIPGSPVGFGDAGDVYLWNGSSFALDIDGPNGVNVDGFDRVAADHYFMSFTGTVTLPGPLTVQNEDVVEYNAGTWSVFFDGTANGLDLSNVDAISVSGTVLYFSTSDTVLPTGVTGVGDDADIYAWDGSSITRFVDATALGWSGNNVDGFVFMDATHFYLSYSPTSTTVGSLGTVQDEDVVYYDGGVWVMYFDGTSKGLTSSTHDVDAFDLP